MLSGLPWLQYMVSGWSSFGQSKERRWAFRGYEQPFPVRKEGRESALNRGTWLVRERMRDASRGPQLPAQRAAAAAGPGGVMFFFLGPRGRTRRVT